jgi:HEAT repeat protein
VRASSLAAALLAAGCGATPNTWHLPIQTRHERARLEDRARVAHLMGDLSDPDPARRAHAADRLVALGAAADPTLHAALRAGGPEEALAVLEILARRPDPAPHVLPAAWALRHNVAATVREAAADRLGLWGDRRAVEALAEALTDRDPRVRAAAARALGRLGPAGAEEALRRATEDPSPPVAREARAALP